METETETDPFLQKRMDRYDDWLEKRKISFSSKVIPVSQSLESSQWVLPTGQAQEILRNARSLAVTDCICRTHYERCNRPVDVCLLLDEIADRFAAEGKARGVSVTEAVDVLGRANENGLVHLTLYMPDHKVYGICSCCSCCCHDLQIVKLFGRKGLIVRSEYVASTDGSVCTACGKCIKRCVFDARVLSDGEMKYHAEKCFGCGLCVTVCPVEATSMRLRNS